jgi:hypothetical protein
MSVISDAYASFGLSVPSDYLLSELLSIYPTGAQQAANLLAGTVMQTAVPIDEQMFIVATGHESQQTTIGSIVSSGLTTDQLAADFVASPTFAAFNNGGVALDPNAPASTTMIDNLFQNMLGHLPTQATLDGFAGMTNAHAFEAFALSDTIGAVFAHTIADYVQSYVDLDLGTPMTQIVGSTTAAAHS